MRTIMRIKEIQARVYSDDADGYGLDIALAYEDLHFLLNEVKHLQKKSQNSELYEKKVRRKPVKKGIATTPSPCLICGQPTTRMVCKGCFDALPPKPGGPGK